MILCTFVIIEVHTKMLWSKPWTWQGISVLKSMTSALFKLENPTWYLMTQDNQLFSYACSCTQGWTLANMTSPLGWIQTLHDKDCSVDAQQIALPKSVHGHVFSNVKVTGSAKVICSLRNGRSWFSLHSQMLTTLSFCEIE